MQIFKCPDCDGDLFFDNLFCACGCEVAFDPKWGRFGASFSACANRSVIRCNWVASESNAFCESCEMTTIHPDLAIEGNELLWKMGEQAKRRVLAGLLRWGWFGAGDGGPRPEFHMLSEATASGPADVTMGHASGLVTINVMESDATERTRRREDLGEPYRTLVGHFRHEIAHFLFERLASSSDNFQHDSRAMFGDEMADYGAALARHYESGPPNDWHDSHISSYASAHPHEDWAESAAHVLHLVDLVDSFSAAHLSAPNFTAEGFDAYAESDASRILALALQIGVALNHVNRGMGLADIYPFVTPPKVMEKLAFAHGWLKRGANIR